jgi:tetraprenyl-beta-curcumene synthase
VDRTAGLALRFLTRVVPRASGELRRLRGRARRIPDRDIAREAQASLRRKAFHVHGACVFATFLPQKAAGAFIKLAASFETAVDYLDNLCDRLGNADETDFRALHESLIDAVTPGAPLRPYFRQRPGADSGYLDSLVRTSQDGFGSLPGYAVVSSAIRDVTARYCELQALKHLAPGVRERRCAAAFADVAPDLGWWEGAAASGSTMATFALAYSAAEPLKHALTRRIFDAYFPYFTALHILLDYFVDQQEDRDHAELNFVAAYPGQDAARDGMTRIARTAYERAASLEDAEVHLFALRAMCGYYCTRPAVRAPELRATATAVMEAAGMQVDAKTALPKIGDRRVRPLLDLYARMSRA